MLEEFINNFPFLSCIKSNDKEYLGIILNCDSSVLSIYDLSMITDTELRKTFLDLGSIWWWESNRKIPINIFLRQETIAFRPFIKTFNFKDIELVFGPMVNLGEIAEKRVKRKSIQLLRSPKNNHN